MTCSQEKRAPNAGDMGAELIAFARKEERQLIARRLYDLEVLLGIVFHAVNNLNDCDLAGEQLEEVLERVSQMRGEYERD